MKKVRLLCLNFLVFVVLLGCLEVGTRGYLKITQGNSTAGLKERKINLNYQPFVMFGPNWDDYLDQNLELKSSQSDSVFTILLVGGSVANGFPIDLLKGKLMDNFPTNKFQIFNMGANGYNARQEAIVTALWGIKLKPDLIISLTGANDFTHRLRTETPFAFVYNKSFEFILTKPYLAPFLELMRSSQFIYGLYRIKERNNIRSITEYADCIPVFIDAQHSINILAKGLHAKRLLILQPHVSFKSFLSEKEKEFSVYQYRNTIVKELYEKTLPSLKMLANRDTITLLNASDLFKEKKDHVFSDDVHFIDNVGYEILADSIVSITLQNEWVN